MDNFFFMMNGQNISSNILMPDGRLDGDFKHTQHEEDLYDNEERKSQDGSDDDYDDDNEDQMDDNMSQMPSDFYSEVDHFLSRPPPNIKIKKKVGNEEALRNETKESTLPLILNKGIAIPSNNDKRPKDKKVKTGRGGNKSSEIFDEQLLKQAFQYVESLSQQEVREEEEDRIRQREIQRLTKSGSAPQITSEDTNPYAGGMRRQYSEESGVSSAPPQRKKDKAVSGKPKGKASVVQRLRSQAANSSAGAAPSRGDFDLSNVAQPEMCSNRSLVDFDALVKNFEQGILLQQLQNDLAESKASMTRSEEFMKKLAQDYSRKGR